MNPKLKEKTMESLAAVLPITGIVFLIGLFFVPLEIGTIAMFLAGAVLLIMGMGFFGLGAEMSMTPIGEGIGVQVAKSRHVAVVALIGIVMGIIITISEPDLQVLAEQVPSVPNYNLIITVAVGVGIFLAMAILRTVFRISLSVLLIILYVLLIGVSFFVPREFLAVAFDSGGVTTGPMTVPFIMAMGIGLTSVRSDKNATNDSFGLVAFASIGPILAVLLLGCFFRPTEAEYVLGAVAEVQTTRDIVKEFLFSMPVYIKDVSISILPILAVFLIFQLAFRRYKKAQVKRVLFGLLYTFIGLMLFLCGVNVGFAPVGAFLGEKLALLPYKWILVPIGALIGYFIVKAEPAIQVLNHQVENVTNGAVSVKAMDRCMSIGVSVSVGLAMLRVLAGIPIYWIIIPGYVAALTLSRFVPKIFVGIAFDSGGVASGPMTTTFLLPLSIGVCSAVGGDLMTDAFGLVALVALTPLVAIQIMGLLYQYKLKKIEKTFVPMVAAELDADTIYEFEEDVYD